jgi:hypothetical protein
VLFGLFVVAAFRRRLGRHTLLVLLAFAASHLLAVVVAYPWTYGYKTILPLQLTFLFGAAFLMTRMRSSAGLAARPAVAAALGVLAAISLAACDRRPLIDVLEASYGLSCKAQRGNASLKVDKACTGLGRCRYVVDHLQLGDPAPGCPKDFEVLWACTGGQQPRRATLPPEASGNAVELSCG